jgi:aromatic-L-amino-acid decarboxylase
MGYPANCGGNLCSGGSVANLIAITTARDKMNIEGERVRDAVVYMTQQVHHCIHKALRIAGLGNTIWRNIPLDASFRMDVERLEKQIQVDRQAGLNPFLVVGSAGTTDVGAVDPLDDLARICSASGCWFHVDGAYGAAFRLLEDKAELFSGMELSDSMVIDPHKGFFLPYGLGIVLIKDKLAMAKSHAYQANYMQDAMNGSDLDFSPADLSPELTKHFRGLRMWMSLKLLGSSALKAGIREKHLLAKYFWQSIQELGFEVGPEPALSVVTYRYPFEESANEMNIELMKYVLADGHNFISSTTIEGDVWLRLAVLSFRTHRDRIDHLMDTLNRGVENLRS